MQLPPHNALPSSAAWASEVNKALSFLEGQLGTLSRRIDTLSNTNTQQLSEINDLRRRLNNLENPNGTD